MPASPWLALRQAQEAIAAGRPDNAHQILDPLLAEGHRRAHKMAREVVLAYVTHARKVLDQHNPDAAWRDLLAAESLNTGEKALAELRLTLVSLALVQARTILEAGRPIDTIDLIAKFRGRGLRHPDLDRLETAAQDWVHATELADRGEFFSAISVIERLAPKLPCPPTGLNQFRADVDERHTRFNEATGRLYDAANAKQWREAAAIATEVLAVAPDHRETKGIRGRAWAVASPDTADFAPALEVNDKSGLHAVNAAVAMFSATRRDSGHAPARVVARSAASGAAPLAGLSSGGGGMAMPKRFLLWIDSVGGYLVCLSNRVTFGQATADGPVDVPLFADVSRTHAEVTRDGEGYVIESARTVRVNGEDVKRRILDAGDRVTFGASCQFLFQRPVPISSSVRLELTSGHRLPVSVEAVLLMGNELMLGPGPNSHVEIKELTAPVIIYRSRDGLGVRVPGMRFSIDDRLCMDRASLPLPAVVTSDAFTFAIEPVTGRL